MRRDAGIAQRNADARSQRGQWAEQLALDHLRARGLKLIERNYRCNLGEIDLILHDARTLVFAEVRYRGRADYGTAAESIDPHKRARILRSASHYLQHHAAAAHAECRFDVVLVQGSPASPSIEWIPDAFQA